MDIETVNHAKVNYPGGLTSTLDPVHFEAEQVSRQEVTLEGAVEAQQHMPIYAYLGGQTEYGLDPWRYLEGIDPHTDEIGFDIWFESGACKTVTRDECPIRFFVDASKVVA